MLNESSFECTCNEGYTGNGSFCTDIDECDNSTTLKSICQENANCTNTLGSYTCTCNAGFIALDDFDKIENDYNVPIPSSGGSVCYCESQYFG